MTLVEILQPKPTDNPEVNIFSEEAQYWEQFLNVAVEVKRPQFVGRDPELGLIVAVINGKPEASANGVQIEDDAGNIYVIPFEEAKECISLR